MLLHLLLLVCKHSRVSFLNKPESNNCLFIHNIDGRLSGNLGETSHNLESSCCSVMLSAGHQNVQKVGMGLHELPDFCIEFLFRCLSHRRGKIFRAVCRQKKAKRAPVLPSCFPDQSINHVKHGTPGYLRASPWYRGNYRLEFCLIRNLPAPLLSELGGSGPLSGSTLSQIKQLNTNNIQISELYNTYTNVIRYCTIVFKTFALWAIFFCCKSGQVWTLSAYQRHPKTHAGLRGQKPCKILRKTRTAINWQRIISKGFECPCLS